MRCSRRDHSTELKNHKRIPVFKEVDQKWKKKKLADRHIYNGLDLILLGLMGVL